MKKFRYKDTHDRSTTINFSILGNVKKPARIAWTELVNAKKGIILYAVLMFLFIMWFMTIFDPDLFSGFESIYSDFPEVILEMIGGQLVLAEFGGFANTYIFSFAWMYFGIYLILRASQDIPKEIENKTIDIVLSKPIKRWHFIAGKYLHHIIVALIITIAVAFGALVGMISIKANFDLEINVAEIFTGILWMFFFLLAIVSTGFFFSTFLNTKLSLAVSFGGMILFYIIGTMVGMFPEAIQDIKYMSFFYYFNPADLLINHDSSFVGFYIFVLFAYSIVLTIIATIIFNKRDIPV
ncbi:MAG: ABC transporter permease subunit [Candidatus Lokiarchaeota archaeon]|nr:ABC transporter permease subunit [Candidatus Lokiarchaeota archaeon]